MTRIRLAHMVEDLKIGGIERVIASIVLGLNKKRYAIEVWCLSAGGDIAEELLGKGVKVKIIGLNSYYNPARIIKLAQLIKSAKIDILHTHGYFASTFGRLAAILARTPVVISHVHSTYYGFKNRNLCIERLLSLFTTKIICVSQAVKNFVENDEKISLEKTILIYNGARDPIKDIDFSMPTSLRERMGYDSDEILLIIVASLTKNKGHVVLIEALDQIAAKIPKLKLLVVGDGPKRIKLEDYVWQLGLFDKVRFTGSIKNVFEWLKASDLFVLPSIEREGLPVALVEAMAAALPVIGSQIGGIPEAIESNVNGFLVPPKNINALAIAIEKMVSDRFKMKKMGEKSREIFSEKFSALKMSENIDALYRQMIFG